MDPPGFTVVRASTLAQKMHFAASAPRSNSSSPSSTVAARISSAVTGGSSTSNRTLTSDPSSSVTWAVTSIVGSDSSRQTLASSMSEGRTPRITLLPSYAERSTPSPLGRSQPPNSSRPARTLDPTRFIGGEPMNAATNRFMGWR